MSEADMAVGGLKVGMTLDQAKAACPTLIVDKGPEGEMWYLSNKRDSFITAVEGKAQSLVLKTAADGKTARGLAVTDSIKWVHELYGVPAESVGSKYWYFSPDKKLGLVINFTDSVSSSSAKVYSISLFHQ